MWDGCHPSRFVCVQRDQHHDVARERRAVALRQVQPVDVPDRVSAGHPGRDDDGLELLCFRRVRGERVQGIQVALPEPGRWIRGKHVRPLHVGPLRGIVRSLRRRLSPRARRVHGLPVVRQFELLLRDGRAHGRLLPSQRRATGREVVSGRRKPARPPVHAGRSVQRAAPGTRAVGRRLRLHRRPPLQGRRGLHCLRQVLPRLGLQRMPDRAVHAVRPRGRLRRHGEAPRHHDARERGTRRQSRDQIQR
mmetsp:Transcript_5491/g.17292  ORF Transcript_5491/g.17292 Transcript_5491/m.17292 type:complete len:249 (+) Transcript_5491:1560-2306(+)